MQNVEKGLGMSKPRTVNPAHATREPHQPAPRAHYAILEAPPPAITDHIKRKKLDIAYAGLSPAQRLDVYFPDEGARPFPVIMSFHGGAFMGGDKGDAQVMPMLEGLGRGYAVVAVNYRLSGEARFPALVHDAKAAVRWVRANAPRNNMDAGRIAAWGGSAGGYLAAMLGTSAGVAKLEDLSLGNPEQRCDVQAVVDWFGPTDFLKMDEQLSQSGFASPPGQEHNSDSSPESLLLGQGIAEIPELVRAANPETYIRQVGPPFLIQHGALDAVVPIQQSQDLAAKLRAAWGADRVTIDVLKVAGHGDPQFEASANVRRVLDFLDAHLKG
jgi:acetyl esterase/lipase